MSIDDQLRRAAARVNAELEGVVVPDPPERRGRGWAALAVTAVLTVAIGATVLWVTDGQGTPPAVPGDSTTTTVLTTEEEDAIEPEAPRPSGPEVVIAEGVVEGSDETWRLSAFVSTAGELCMRLRGALHCGPVPNPATLLSSPSTSVGYFPGPRLSCVSGGLAREVADVTLTFSDGSRVTAAIHPGGELPASFYAYCWVGDLDLVSVGQVLDTDGETLADLIELAPNDDSEALTASFTLAYSRSDSFYGEGSATEFDLFSSSGQVTAGAVLLPVEDEELLRIELAPGTYTIRNWQRPCPGSCGSSLEPPVDVCAARFTVDREASITAVVTVRPGQGCTFDFLGVEAAPIEPGGYAALTLTFPVAGSG